MTKTSTLLAILLLAALFVSAQNASQSEEYMRNMAIGNKALEMGRTQDAINAYKELIRISPASPDPYLILGNIYARNEKDAESVELAIYYYKLYLEADPQAGNASQIKTKIYELEYVQKDAVKAQELQKSMIGRWASCLYTNDEGTDYVLFDFTEVQGKIRVTIDPASMVGSQGLGSRVAYAERSGDEYTFAFTEDKTHVPSQSSYNLLHSLLDMVPGAAGYTSELGKNLGHSAVASMQEKDVIRNSKRMYQFYLKESNGEMTQCACRELFVETTHAGQNVLRDTMFTCMLFAVDKDYSILPPYQAWIRNKYRINTALQSNHPDIYKLAKSGADLKGWGYTLTGVGAFTAGMGAILMTVKTQTSADIDQEKADRMTENNKKAGKYVTAIGGAMVLAGVPMICIGVGKAKKSKALYREAGVINSQQKSEMGRAIMLKAGPASVSATYNF